MNKQLSSKSYSLRSFLRNQLLLLISFIISGFACLMLYLYIDGLDIATRKGLVVIGSYYAQLHDEGKLEQASLETEEFSIFVGQENLPAWISSKFTQEKFANYTLFKSYYNAEEHQRAGKAPLLFTATPIEKGKRQLFAVYHFRDHPNPATIAPPHILETVLLITFAVFLVLLLVVTWMARRFNRRVIEPMEALADMAHKVDESTPGISHPILDDRSEIGLVAHALKQGMERIHTFHQREKTFLQNASHELRTPITVVGSALDIIERRLTLGKQDISTPLKHIRQACVNMKETTEALLWLSREEPISGSYSTRLPEQSQIKATDLQDILTELVDQLGYLIEGREINVTISMHSQDLHLHDPALVRIVMSNLIQNAFEHTFEGRIDIDIYNTEICIADTGIGLIGDTDPTKRGESGRGSFGLGLDIVSRIAAKKGWKLSLDRNSYGGCTATLNWEVMDHRIT
ncbi:sensor histidine kinase [Neptunomonas sp.]|uniref:sensor histidine kinase n=1 Tax=Neptunomonas sp. TaxID=1971898 RepID=UPI0035693643